ncbi:amidase [Pusillimonas sp. DMV24BSW_D]|uniref:amidase n=1 Tax=Neopusillimonas aestuarii TaxID=2716226 RepID=UPI00140CED22|nr:amidase [Pusillimonas sp. DMV24BSW_D]QIM48480.1 amidase [Pusillimonas sp. DMV24BSW_D]
MAGHAPLERADALRRYIVAASEFYQLHHSARLDDWCARIERNLSDNDKLAALSCRTSDPFGLPMAGAQSDLFRARGAGGTQANELIKKGRLAAHVARIKEGRLDPVEHVQACLDRIKARSDLNAFLFVDHEGALTKAHELQGQIQAGRHGGPMAGVVVAVKDCIPVAGLPMRAGSESLASVVPQESAPCVAALESAGAIVIGMTNLHELCYGGVSDNPHYGSVGHPQDSTRSPGGSSGGSAVALATEMADIALGTDTAGSVRMPAAVCGVVGYKGSYDLVSRKDLVPLAWSLDHVGVFAHKTVDAAWVTAIMAGHDAQAYWQPLQFDSVSQLKLFCPTNYSFDLIEPSVLTAFESALARLESAGVKIQRGALPALDMSPTLQHFTMAPEATQAHEELGLQHAHAMGEEVRTRLEAGQFIRAIDYIKAQRLRRVLAEALEVPLLSGAHAIVTPTTVTGACDAQATLENHGKSVPLRSVLTRLTLPFNLTGVPAISLPCGRDAEGFPVGLQLAGLKGGDALLLQAAHQCETVLQM